MIAFNAYELEAGNVYFKSLFGWVNEVAHDKSCTLNSNKL